MKKILFLITFNLLFISVKGQLLWKVSGNGLTSSSYLFGTIHAIPKNRFYLSDSVKSAFNSCRSVSFEIDINPKLSDISMMVSQMRMPKGTSIENVLSKSDFSRLKSYCEDTLGIKKKKFKRYLQLKPFYFSAMLLMEQLENYTGYEKEFSKMAKQQNKELGSLETIQFQMETVNKIKIEDQAKMIMESLGSENAEFNEMVDLYTKEDIKSLYQIITQEAESIPEFNYHFLETRNKNWIPLIEKQINAQSTFIAIGAGHLEGPTGLLNLLKEKGYNLAPIK